MRARSRGAATLFVVGLCCLSCSVPERPREVASDAVRVEGSKTGYWQTCKPAEQSRVHCTVWNDSGTVLKDESYFPLDEGPLPMSSELKIRPGKICSGPYQVCLSNGRVLLPESQFEQLKAFMKGGQR